MEETKTIDLKKRIDLLLAKSLVLANFINRNTEMCCFIDDTAHCDYVEFKMHDTKKDWNSPGVKFTYHYEINGNVYKDSENKENDLIEFVEFLERSLNDKKIDYSYLYAETKEVIDYYTL